MAKLFEETEINHMTMRNRLVRSATWEGMCGEDGRPTEKLTECYRDLAEGGVALIITGYAFVRPDGRQMPGQLGIHIDGFKDDFKKMTAAVHDSGGTLAVQLVHAGGQTGAKTAGRRPLAPSAVKVDQFPETPAELSKREISGIVDAFGESARRAMVWGFDGVQLHAAHGYLINQFLSPHTNRRTDNYGGDIENRCRFLMEVYQEVRGAVGADFPVLVKLTGADNLTGGMTNEDAVYAACKLSDAGVDAIEVSGGTSASGEGNPVREKIIRPEKEAYNMNLARPIKEAVKCPVMLVGGFRSYEVAEKAVNAEGIDYISMARPLIWEPGLVNRWLGGDRSPAKCISCNGCFMPGVKEGGIYCVIAKKKWKKTAK